MIERRPRLQAATWWILALAITGLAFGLRIHALGVPNLTSDEWFMLRNHDQGPLWIIHQAHTFEPHPLLYYLGLAGWIELAGRTEFAMRFPSVAFGVLLAPGLIGLGRAILGRRAGLIAGALVALNPYQIAEAQNARNYAMVVAVSALASLLFLRALQRNRRRDWIAYGAAMLLALNTHYDAALVLAVHVMYAAVLSIAHRGCPDRWLTSVASFPQKGSVRRWLLTTSVVAVVLGLWLLYASPSLLAYHGYFPEAVSLQHVLARSLATFSLGQTIPVRQALPAFGLAMVGAAWLIYRKPPAAIFLGLYTLLPILAVSLLFMVRPMFDERYLIVLAPGYLLVLAAALDGLLRVALPIGILASVGTLVVLAPTIPQTYQTMLTDRTDYRSMVAWVSTDGSPDDPIIATGYGQAELFGYYYRGPRKVQVIDQPTELAAELPGILRDHDGLWLLPYWQSPVDQAALSVLDRDAAPAAERWFVNTRALYFASARRLTQPSPARATWDDRLTLERSTLTAGEVAPGDALAAELHWTVATPLATPKLSLRLLDESGAPVTQSDLKLTTAANLAAGDGVTRIGLLVPPSVPPGPYLVAIVLYHPDSGAALKLSTASTEQDGALVLGSVEVGARQWTVPPAESGVALITPVGFPEGVSLLGHDALGPPRPAGAMLSFRALWRADRSPLAAVQRTVFLQDQRGKRTTLVTGPILPSYPTSKWSAGQVLAERIAAKIPPTLTNGTYQVLVAVGSADNPPVRLGEAVVSGPDRSFTAPMVPHSIGARFGSFAVLLGDGAAVSGARPGNLVDVTLFWAAKGTADRSETAFVHLVDPSGVIRGQIDRAPVNGTRMTDGWVAGEYLTDEYRVPLAKDAPAGKYRIEVGLYDPKSGARVPVVASDGSASDHVVAGTFEVGG